jgi:concanavalin A-like lectin/glucanase superfamily protein
MADVSDGLVAYYPFNGNANDETDNGYDGTVDGATLTDDRFGNPMSAYSFDGFNDKILIGQEPNFPSWNTYAVSVWFLNNGGGDQGTGYGQKVLSKAEFFTDFHLSVFGDTADPHTAGNLSWWSSQGGFDSVTDTSKDYRDNVWHHAVLNKNTASEGDLWIDGVLQVSSNTLAAVVNSVNLVIGYTEHSDIFQQKHWSGKIDDIRIYNRVLSASEILELLVEGGSPPPDHDGDGIPDSEDACPNSDLSTTIIIDGCDSGVANTLFPTGCTISDLIMQCADDVNNHGEFVSCVAHLTNKLKTDGTITGQQKGAIQSCAAQANIP